MADDLRPFNDSEAPNESGEAANADLTAAEQTLDAAEQAINEPDALQNDAEQAEGEGAEPAAELPESLPETLPEELADELLKEPVPAAAEQPDAAQNPELAVEAALAAASQPAAAQRQPAQQKRALAPPAKKNIRKKKPARSIEEDIKDLEEEEKRFDSWGRPIRKKKKKRKKSRKLSCTLVLLTLILAVSSVLAVGILAVAKEMYGIDKDISERIVVIPQGATTAEIAKQLEEEKLISLPRVFRLVSRMNKKDGAYIAGEHVLSASMSYEDMIEELCYNHVEERDYVRVTFREGISLLDAAKILQENEVCNAEQFLFYFNAGGYGFRFE